MSNVSKAFYRESLQSYCDTMGGIYKSISGSGKKDCNALNDAFANAARNITERHREEVEGRNAATDYKHDSEYRSAKFNERAERELTEEQIDTLYDYNDLD